MVNTVVPFDPLQLAVHYARHRPDFAGATVTDYEVSADQFLAKPHGPEILDCIRPFGRDRVRYDTLTTEFAVQSAAGLTRTYFKARPCSSIPPGLPRVRCHGFATNEDYFNSECLKW